MFQVSRVPAIASTWRENSDADSLLSMAQAVVWGTLSSPWDSEDVVR